MNFAVAFFRVPVGILSTMALETCLQRLALFHGHDEARFAVVGIWLFWTMRASVRVDHVPRENAISAGAIEFLRLVVALMAVIAFHFALLRMPAMHDHEILSSWVSTLVPLLIVVPDWYRRGDERKRPIAMA